MASSDAGSNNGERGHPLMVGQLWKRSDHLKLWKPRHFYFGSLRAADGTFAPVLVYKEKEADERPKGHIALDGSVGLLPTGEEHPTLCCFYINGPKKKYVLGAENIAEAQAWVAAILTTVRASIAAGTIHRAPHPNSRDGSSTCSEGAFTVGVSLLPSNAAGILNDRLRINPSWRENLFQHEKCPGRFDIADI
eukprot:139449-Prorocentrum_minimum.AAC.8